MGAFLMLVTIIFYEAFEYLLGAKQKEHQKGA